MLWKPDWPTAKQNLIKWWKGKGLAANVQAPLPASRLDMAEPAKPADLEERWTDPEYRFQVGLYKLSRTFNGGEGFPFFEAGTGPGSLGTYLGSTPHFAETTVWYDPCITDPDKYGPIKLDQSSKWWRLQHALIDRALADGRFKVSVPDLIENLDTLAALRGSEQVLMDVIERPAWAQRCVEEITEAWIQAFDLIYRKVRDEDGGNVFSHFSIWGPGKTGKLQCDISCMLSPAMFRQFIQPSLRRQCRFLDYSLYHFDGTTAMQHLDGLLEINELTAIQWTPQSGRPQPGDPIWYDLYKRIRSAGKSVQLMRIQPNQIRPLLDAVGPEGMWVTCHLPNQAAAEKLLAELEEYR